MKRIREWAREVATWVVLLFLLALGGCAMQPAKYDSAEFSVYADLWQWSKRLTENCGEEGWERKLRGGLDLLTERAQLFAKYGLQEDSKVYSAEVKKLVDAFKPGGSVVYCKASSENITTGVERVMEQLGRRDR